MSAYEDRLCYFCSPECQLAFRNRQPICRNEAPRPPATLDTNPLVVAPVASDERQHIVQTALHDITTDSRLDEVIGEVAPPDEYGPLEQPPLARPVRSLVAVSSSEIDTETLLLVLSIVGALLSLALTLAGDSGIALVARLIVVTVATLALASNLWLSPRNALSLPVLVQTWPILAATVVAAVACLVGHREASALTNANALIIATTAVNVLLIRRCRQAVEHERSQLKLGLEKDANRYHEESFTVVDPQDLRPGEEIVVGPGEVVPADGTISAGQAQVIPWYLSTEQVVLAEGSSIVAGAQVVEGRLRVIVSWSGLDRAWLRLTVDTRRRADLNGTWARTGRLIALRLAPVVAGLTALTVYAAGQSPLEILGIAVASYCAFCSAAIAELPALHVSRGVFTALRRGIAFRSSESIDRAGRVSTAAFCARGTLLLGEPEVTGIYPFGNATTERVLELAAGAQSGSQDPMATAILRAARAKGVRADAVRSPTFFPVWE